MDLVGGHTSCHSRPIVQGHGYEPPYFVSFPTFGGRFHQILLKGKLLVIFCGLLGLRGFLSFMNLRLQCGGF